MATSKFGSTILTITVPSLSKKKKKRKKERKKKKDQRYYDVLLLNGLLQ